MGILYEERKKIRVNEKSWYEVNEFIDSGCYPGCGFNVSIHFCDLKPMSEEERAREIRSLNKTIESLTRRLDVLKACNLRKPDFKALQRLVSSTKKGTPEHEDALRKLKKAHREWAAIRALITNEKGARKQLESAKNMLKKVMEGTVLKTTRKHLVHRCFFWDDADEEVVNSFIHRFVSDPEFRLQSMKGEAEWCHINRIYVAASDLLFNYYSAKPSFLGYTVGDRRGEKEYKRLSKQFDNWCMRIYEFVGDHVKELMSDPRYKEALEKDNLEEFVRAYVLPGVGCRLL